MTTGKPADYNSLSSELDSVLERLQADGIDIDEAVKLYERGTELVKELEKYLKQASNKVTKIKNSLN